jgi:hypothetical protein
MAWKYSPIITGAWKFFLERSGRDYHKDIGGTTLVIRNVVATIPFSRINEYFTSLSCDLFLTCREKNRSDTYTISTYSNYGDILVFFLQRIVAEQLYLLELMDVLLVQARTDPSWSHARSQLIYQPNSHHPDVCRRLHCSSHGNCTAWLGSPNPNIGEPTFIFTVFVILTYTYVVHTG